jgi:hypothetical protein
MSRFSHHAEGWTLKRRRISIIGHVGALIDLTVPKNTGYSGWAVWRKLRPDILRL